MKINRDNIEEWMFKYHEGVLSEADKKQVLSYVSMDESLAEEFRLWSVTRLAANPSTEYPDLSQKLFKKDPFYHTGLFKSLCYFFLGAVLAGALSWWYWTRSAHTASSQPFTKTETSHLSPKEDTTTSMLSKTVSQPPTAPDLKKTPSHKSNIPRVAPLQPHESLPQTSSEDHWTSEPLHLEPLPLQDSTERNAFDQRQLTYPKRRISKATNKVEKPSKKRKINLKRQWKFKEEDGNF